MNRHVVGLLALALLGCGGGGGGGSGGGAYDLFANSRVQQAIREYRSQPGAWCGWGCEDSNHDGSCTPGEFQGDDGILGHWVTVNTRKTYSSSGAGVGTEVGMDITFTARSGNHLEQGNAYGGTSGEGDAYVSRMLPTPGTNEDKIYTVIQSNHATGYGCSQDVINLLGFFHLPNWGVNEYRLCALTVVIDSSGCTPDAWWAVSEGGVLKQ